MVAENDKDLCLSLDEYIERKKIDGSLCFLDYRKRHKNIDKDELDENLETIARDNASKRKSNRNELSKFDRFNDTDDSNSDDEDSMINMVSNDVKMMDLSDKQSIREENSSIRFAKEIQLMEHPDCCKIKKTFKTMESKMGVKMKSQQWRVQPNGTEFSQSDDNMNKIRIGRVKKNQNSRKDFNTKSGTFIEKGNFTYKLLSSNGNKNNNIDSVVGILRNKPPVKIVNGNRTQNNVSVPNINVNMNWNGFFKGMTQCMQAIKPVQEKSNNFEAKTISNVKPSDDIQVKIAASELFEFLQAKRGQSCIDSKNDSMDSYEPYSENVVNARAGDGIDFKVVPKITNLPLNLRFA